MVNEAPAPKLPHYVNCLLQHPATNFRRRPPLSQDVLVQVLTRSDAKKEAALEEGRSRRGRLGHDCRMNANSWTGNARTDSKLACASCDRPEHRPDKRALALRVNPRVEVIGDQSKWEPGLFGSTRVSDQIGRTVLFARKCVTDLHQASVPAAQPSRNLSASLART